MCKILGSCFKDEQGRTLMLRGVNLGGSSKLPFRPNGATHISEGFYDHRSISFVGRPFSLDEADEHFSRLRSWGFTFLRFLVTWEAIEHAGPGVYDEEYLDYLYKVVRKAGEYGIDLFIDPHQDVWSRFSGGDGAPGWTFEVIGMDLTHFADTGAAIVHCIHGDPFPRMIWPTNYFKLAAATMFTLFFGGNDFAPQTKVNGEPVQEFLQRHYIAAIKQVALRLKGLPNVVGYGSMNEVSAGFIGCADINSTDEMGRLGESPTPFQAMLLGAGFSQDVEVWDVWHSIAKRAMGVKLCGRRTVNPGRVRVWREGNDCIWKENGVWELDGNGVPRILRSDHFARRADSRAVDFSNDYLRPFINRYAREIRSISPDAVIFIEGVPNTDPPRWGSEDAPNVVNATHWYDVFTLFTKRYIPFLGIDVFRRKVIFGRKRVQRSFIEQLARIKKWSAEQMGDIPTLIGEFGIPFDMCSKKAYRSGNFNAQVRAMDNNFCAIEANRLNCTLWNYTPDNDNYRGDQWNGEDLSIFSRDQQTNPTDINSGGRALDAVVRPYPRKIAGEPVRVVFNLKQRLFEFEFRHDPAVSAPTEIFVPNYQYPDGYIVDISDGTYETDLDSQTLIYQHNTTEREAHTIRIRCSLARP